MPEKLTTAPMSVRPRVSSAISRATSKSACWMRMVTGAFMGGSAAGHRREEGDLARARYRGVRFDMGMVDRGANHLRLFECVGVGIVARGQPFDQVVDGAYACRRLDGLFRLADPLAHPGEILQLHPSSSLMR